MPTLPKHTTKRPWIQSDIKEGKRQTDSDNALYHTMRWKRIRAVGLKIEPLCRECKSKGKTKAATVRDHIVPVSKGGDFWDMNNHQSLCNSCHASKSGKEAHT